MRRAAWRVLLVVSLCMNAGFLSALAVHKLHHRRSHSIPGLNLTPITREKFDSNFAAFQAGTESLRGELRAERARLIDLLASPSPSPEAIRAQQERVLAAEAKMLEAFTEHLANQKRLLGPREQRVFFDFIQHRKRESGHKSPAPFEEKHP